MPPKVSILVPSYNHARFLRATLDGVLAQSFGDWELILVDDGSSDDSVEIARSYSDARIQVHVNERNLGTYGTQQRALDMATGEFVAVLNSDDLWSPPKLERQVAALEADSEAGFAYVLGWKVDEEGRVDEGEDVHADWPTAPRQDPLPHLLHENRVLASGVLFRREGLRFETGCRYSGDWVALLRFALRGPCVCVPERLTYWRMHGANTFKASPGQMAEEIRVRESIARFGGWFVPRLDAGQVRAALGRNAMDLAALHTVFLNRPGIGRAAATAIRLYPNRVAALKRCAPAWLAPSAMRRRLWSGKIDFAAIDVRSMRAALNGMSLIDFSR